MPSSLIAALEQLTWLGLLAVAVWTINIISERLVFFWGLCAADPVELSLCLARWERSRRATGPIDPALGWLKALVRTSHTPRELLHQLHLLRTALYRGSLQLPAAGNAGTGLGLFGTTLSLLRCGESSDRMQIIALGVGTTVAGVAIYIVAQLTESAFRSRSQLLLPQVEEAIVLVVELMLMEPDEPKVRVAERPSSLRPSLGISPRRRSEAGTGERISDINEVQSPVSGSHAATNDSQPISIQF